MDGKCVKLHESSDIKFNPVEQRSAKLAPPFDAAVQEEKEGSPVIENLEFDDVSVV